MNRRGTKLALLGLAGILTGSLPLALAHEVPNPPAISNAATEDTVARAAANMAMMAQNFWAALTPEQQAKAGFQFDNEERFNWHFIPRERKGLTWNEMTPAQQALGHALLASGLSQRGYEMASTIMSLEQILKDIEHDDGKKRNAGNYAFSIFGTPGEKNTWGFRVEGHHLSLHFTIAGGKAVAGPVFFGTNPAQVREGPRKGLRVLAVEEDLGFELIKSLNDDQRKKAVIEAVAPKEVITGNSRKANPGEPKGLPASEMTPAQKKLLMTLVEQYAYRLRPELADDDLAKIEKAGFEKIRFAWAGVQDASAGHYYRLHGPTFLVEFDNTQNDANHVHTVWRDSANDFGEDMLKEHYDQSKH